MQAFRAVVAAALLLAASPVRAGQLELEFAASWTGLPAGRVSLALSEADGRYAAHAEIRSTGLPKLLTGFRATADSAGEIDVADDGPQPGARYAADYRLRGREKRTRFAYAEDGAAALPERGAGDSSERAELAAERRRDAFDPLAALVAFRQRLLAGALTPGRAFAIAVYDGRRRFDVEGTLPAATRPEAFGGQPVYVVDLVLRPVAGFTADELAAEEDVDPEARPARVVISVDGRALPLAFSAPAAGFPLVLRLVRACDGGACVAFDGAS